MEKRLLFKPNGDIFELNNESELKDALIESIKEGIELVDKNKEGFEIELSKEDGFEIITINNKKTNEGFEIALDLENPSLAWKALYEIIIQLNPKANLKYNNTSIYYFIDINEDSYVFIDNSTEDYNDFIDIFKRSANEEVFALKVKDVLEEIVASEKSVIIHQILDEVGFEYGMFDEKMQRVVANDIEITRLWDIVYNVIINYINPNAEIDFMEISDHKGMTIDINNNVVVCITNTNHIYDEWINEMYKKHEQKLLQNKK